MKKTKLTNKWDLSTIGTSLTDPRFAKQYTARVKKIESFARRWTKDTSYISNPKKLLDSLLQYEQLTESDLSQANEGYYLFLRSSLETNNPRVMAAYKRYVHTHTPLENKLTFYVLSLGTIDKKTQAVLLRDKSLSHYHFFLKQIFDSAQFFLSESEENLSSLLFGVSAGNWKDMVDEFLSKSTELALTERNGVVVEQEQGFEECTSNIRSPIQEVRDSAAVAINTMFERLGDVYEKEFNSFLERKQIFDQLRGYDRPDRSRHMADTIDSATVDTMLSVVKKNFSLSRKFYAFKAQVLGKKKLAYHEREVPLGQGTTSFSFENSVDIVQRAFNTLDSEFADIFSMFVQQGRIDVFPQVGKTGGAFCIGSSKDTPTYILLNHTNTIRSLTTLAHEAGHGIHNELMRPEQSALYCGTSLATAEVASIFCEEFALREAMLGMSEEERFAVLGENLSSRVASIVRQSAFYFFEQEIHQAYRAQGYLTKAEIGKIFSKHMKAYMGPAVSQDAGSENWWMHVGHFRRSFYVYSYASGEMIAGALQNMVFDNPESIEQVKQLLRLGHSDTAENIFKRIGIDITKQDFWEQSFVQMKKDFKELQALAKRLGKI